MKCGLLNYFEMGSGILNFSGLDSFICRFSSLAFLNSFKPFLKGENFAVWEIILGGFTAFQTSSLFKN